MYNAKRYIKTAIESVLSQTFSDFELIIVNDCSTDDSLKIVEKFSKADKRVRIISKTVNEGLFHARLTAFEEAGGNYIISLDADDILDFSALEIIHNIVIKNPESDIIYFKSKKFKDSNEPMLQHMRYRVNCVDNLIEETYYEGHNLAEYQKQLILSHSLNSMWSKTFRRDLLLKHIDLLESFPRITSGEDCIHSLYGSLNARQIVFINCTLYYYRVNIESMTHRMNGHEFESWVTVMEQREKFISLWHLESISLQFLIYQRKALAKLLVYNPYVVGADSKDKYHNMLGCILENKRCQELLKIKGGLSPVWTLPLWAFRKKHFGMLFIAKQWWGMLRRFI